MARSLKKGPFVDEKLVLKVDRMRKIYYVDWSMCGDDLPGQGRWRGLSGPWLIMLKHPIKHR